MGTPVRPLTQEPGHASAPQPLTLYELTTHNVGGRRRTPTSIATKIAKRPLQEQQPKEVQGVDDFCHNLILNGRCTGRPRNLKLQVGHVDFLPQLESGFHSVPCGVRDFEYEVQ